MGMLQQGFPKAQMMVCGVLGPKSNARAERVSACALRQEVDGGGRTSDGGLSLIGAGVKRATPAARSLR